MTLAAIDGRVALLLLALLVAVFYALRAAVRANPQPATDQAAPAITKAPECDVRGCHYLPFWWVTRRGTSKKEHVCQGCYDEGTAWGWWQ